MKRRKMYRIGELREMALAEKEERKRLEREKNKKKRLKLRQKAAREAAKILEASDVRVARILKSAMIPKYSGPQVLFFNEDCSLLQHLNIMRSYMKFKYNLEIEILETILYLYPLNYFTAKDYQMMPFSSHKSWLSSMLKNGYVTQVSTERGPGCIYALSLRSKKMVKQFYALLSGEERIPEADLKKPWTPTEARYHNKKPSLLKQLLDLPVPESKRRLYE